MSNKYLFSKKNGFQKIINARVRFIKNCAKFYYLFNYLIIYTGQNLFNKKLVKHLS